METGTGSDARAYWLTKTMAERLEALELMRQAFFGYDPEKDRMQKVLEVVTTAALDE